MQSSIVSIYILSLAGEIEERKLQLYWYCLDL